MIGLTFRPFNVIRRCRQLALDWACLMSVPDLTAEAGSRNLGDVQAGRDAAVVCTAPPSWEVQGTPGSRAFALRLDNSSS